MSRRQLSVRPVRSSAAYTATPTRRYRSGPSKTGRQRIPSPQVAKDTSGYVIWRTFLDDVAKRMRIAELKKYGVKPLNEESLSAITGGSYGDHRVVLSAVGINSRSPRSSSRADPMPAGWKSLSFVPSAAMKTGGIGDSTITRPLGLANTHLRGFGQQILRLCTKPPQVGVCKSIQSPRSAQKDAAQRADARTSPSVLRRISISMGLATCASMPASRDAFTSSWKAFADMATIGMRASSASSSLRMERASP